MKKLLFCLLLGSLPATSFVGMHAMDSKESKDVTLQTAGDEKRGVGPQRITDSQQEQEDFEKAQALSHEEYLKLQRHIDESYARASRSSSSSSSSSLLRPGGFGGQALPKAPVLEVLF